MADLTKRVARKLEDRLYEGETVRVAVLVETAGTYGGGGVGLVLAPAVTRHRLETAARDNRDEQFGTAADFPVGSCVILITSARTLVVLSNGVIFGRTVMDLAPGDLRIGTTRRRLLAREVELVFSDGSTAAVDVPFAQPFNAFAAALGRSRQEPS